MLGNKAKVGTNDLQRLHDARGLDRTGVLSAAKHVEHLGAPGLKALELPLDDGWQGLERDAIASDALSLGEHDDGEGGGKDELVAYSTGQPGQLVKQLLDGQGDGRGICCCRAAGSDRHPVVGRQAGNSGGRGQRRGAAHCNRAASE